MGALPHRLLSVGFHTHYTPNLLFFFVANQVENLAEGLTTFHHIYGNTAITDAVAALPTRRYESVGDGPRDPLACFENNCTCVTDSRHGKVIFKENSSLIPPRKGVRRVTYGLFTGILH